MTAGGTLRISGGEHRGRRIPLPRNHDLRPTSEKARQAYFNIISGRVDDAAFLDLFAGTGVFAMEALSRGARSATAVESSRRAAEQITTSAESIGLNVRVLTADVYRAAATLRNDAPWDLIYADPPYADARWNDLLTLGSELLADDGLMAVEHWTARKDELPESAGAINRSRTVTYGTVAISLYERTS